MCRHGASGLGDGLLDGCFEDGFCLADYKNIGQAFLHGNSNDMPRISILNHLVQLANMHRVEHFLHDCDLARWFDIHTLLLIHRNVVILSCIDAIDS